MQKIRYMLVDHPKANEQLGVVDGKVQGKMPVHDLVGTYHWVRLDDDTIFLMADYRVSNHDALHTHPKISVLPSHASSRSVKAHISKMGSRTCVGKHTAVLMTKFALTDDCTMEDLLERIVAKHGALFAMPN